MHLLPDVTHIIETYGYIGIFIVVLLESGILFALPGDSLLFTAGLLATLYGLNLFFLIPMIFVATFLGGLIGYYIGTHFTKLHRYAFFRKVISKEHIEVTHDFFDKHGKFTVLVSRFIPVIRTFTPIVAGASKMNRSLFIRYSLVSAALWSTIVTLTGYFLGRAFPWIKDYLSYLIIIVVFISILPGLVGYIRNKRKES